MSNILVIDFDKTITTNESLSCYRIFLKEGVLKERLRNYMIMLFDLYERRKTLNEPFMMSWLKRVHNIIKLSEITSLKLRFIVKDLINKEIFLRRNVRKLVEDCNNNNVKIIVYSAGIEEIIKIIFEEYGINTNNMTIVANSINFSNDGTIHSFRQPLITKCNKNYKTLKYLLKMKKNNNKKKKIKIKKNSCIVVGDSKNDIYMVKSKYIKISFAYTSNRNGFHNYDRILDHKNSANKIRSYIRN